MEPQRNEKKWHWFGWGSSDQPSSLCVAPRRVVLLGVVGLGAVSGYLDDVLLPALAMFCCDYRLRSLSETTIDHEKKPYSSVR